ncbi:MAG: hydantoinase/oxoprolinase family protein, partial [Chloroflexi bacterium]|nr:hydantoinase/oxoprolinase family protein [Chloroflexota bacterium]
SSGGITTAAAARELPIRLTESGPAAGALVGGYYGDLTGVRNVIAFDMGGTTAKICLINDGKPDGANTVEVARVRRFKKGSGLPLKVPVIEMIEIGAGGGSIARVDNLGLLKVGPDSAGANPGPACYGLGGSEPTVTDADLVLGYLDSDFFLGGELRLDRAAAERAIAERVARPLGVDLVAAALGIHDVVNDTMATATRIHIAERGRDPRRYDLMAFGGAGPVHAYELARLLKLRRVVAPLRAGALSALGLLAAPLAVNLAQAYVGRLDRLDWAHVDRLYDDMEKRASDLLLRAGARREEIVLRRTADLRYVGQGHEVIVPVLGGRLSAQSRTALEETFAETYRQLYDRHLTDVPVEALNWRLHGATPPPRVDVTFTGGDAGTEGRGDAGTQRRGDAETRRPGDTGTGGRGDARKGERAVYFGAAKDYLRTPVYDRYALRPGDHLSGPAVVEERESTLLIGPGGRAVVDDYLNLIVEVVL